ncbi:MAG: hypothetical protein AAF992_09375 [Bacteroidota bacterium]
MEPPQTSQRLTLAEYNQLEEETQRGAAQQRYEYHDGEVFAMARATTDVRDPVHIAIVVNMTTILSQMLRKIRRGLPKN